MTEQLKVFISILLLTLVAESAVANPVFYEGRCSLRFEKGNEMVGRLLLKPADICLPTGWRVLTMASTDASSFRVVSDDPMPNVIFIKAGEHASAAPVLWWFYPVNQAGKAEEKIQVEIRMDK